MIGVLVSGEGTNLQALLDEGLPVVAVASNRPNVHGLVRAQRAGAPTAVFALGDFPDRETRDEAMADWLVSQQVRLVVCAGYMHLLTPAFLARFPGRVVNVHPAPLPAFPGAHPLEDVLAAGAPEAAATVHFVDEGVDTGPILLQRSIELNYTRPVHEVTAEIHAVEHELLPRAIELIADGVVSFDDENPRLCRIEER